MCAILDSMNFCISSTNLSHFCVARSIYEHGLTKHLKLTCYCLAYGTIVWLFQQHWPMVLRLATQLFWSTLWLILLVLHEVLFHGFLSPFHSFPLSWQTFHVIVVKKNCCHLWFSFIDNLKTYTTIWCANNKCKGQGEKTPCKMFKPFHLCHKRVCIEKGYLRWSGHWLIIWHPLVKIDKLPTLVGTKMYTFARFFNLCNVSLSFHIIYYC